MDKANPKLGEPLSAWFVWTKMQTESGIGLQQILALKEIERLAGDGIFWWGIGKGLGNAVQTMAIESGGTLPVLFSMMLARPQKRDSNPGNILIWTQYDDYGTKRDLPAHVLSFSRDHERDTHYALACHSHMPLSLTSHGAFDPNRCTTINGKRPGAIQTTALLQGNPYEYHPDGKYHFGFRATLIRPWVVKLLTPVKTNLTGSKLLVEGWKEDWKKFIAQNRGAASRL